MPCSTSLSATMLSTPFPDRILLFSMHLSANKVLSTFLATNSTLLKDPSPSFCRIEYELSSLSILASAASTPCVPVEKRRIFRACCAWLTAVLIGISSSNADPVSGRAACVCCCGSLCMDPTFIRSCKPCKDP